MKFDRTLLRLPLLTLALGALVAPTATWAQDLPSYAHPQVVSTDETVHGRIASVDGAFQIALNDDRGFVDTIALHQGTIINPTGLTLAPGMSVTINGYAGGSVFNANEIDTPYSYSGAFPTPVYYGPGYWAPGFGYGYGPSFSIAFIFGGGYGHFERRGFYGRPWDGSRYFGGYIGHRDYDGGRGRSFTGSVHVSAGDRIPAAFDRQSFAGRAYAGNQTPAGVTQRFPQGERLNRAPVRETNPPAIGTFAQRNYGERGIGERGIGERSVSGHSGERYVGARSSMGSQTRMVTREPSGVEHSGGAVFAGGHSSGGGYQSHASAGRGGGAHR